MDGWLAGWATFLVCDCVGFFSLDISTFMFPRGGQVTQLAAQMTTASRTEQLMPVGGREERSTAGRGAARRHSPERKEG